MSTRIAREHIHCFLQLTVCVVLVIWLQGCSPGRLRHAKPVADRFLHLLSSGQYTRALGMIEPKRRRAYQASHLAQRWAQLEQAVGKPYAISLTGIYATVSVDLAGGAGNNKTGTGLRFAYEITGTKGSYAVNVWLRHDGKRWRVWDVSIPSSKSLPTQKSGPSPAKSDRQVRS